MSLIFAGSPGYAIMRTQQGEREYMNDLSGQTIGGYEVLGLIGRGGMASVYRARQLSIGRIVALKVLPGYFMHEETFLKRFQREAQAIARLQHPRILPVYDYGEDKDVPYIAMAYIEGGSLAEMIQQEGGLPLDEASRLLVQIAEGLDFAHEQGVIHRDFKPSNVLLDGRRNAYLADFGIAKVSQETAQLTGSGIVGTPTYMAPEMFKNEPISRSIDLYALGVTLYQMLSGTVPFGGTTPVQLMYAHLNQPVPNIAALKQDLPLDIQIVLNTAMAKNPEDRYPNATVLAKAFQAALSGEAGESGDIHSTVPMSASAGPADKDTTVSMVEPELALSAPPPAPPSLPSERGRGRGREHRTPEREARRGKRRDWWQRNGRIAGAILILLAVIVTWRAEDVSVIGLGIVVSLVLIGFHLQKRNWWRLALWAGIPLCGVSTVITHKAGHDIAVLFAVILTLDSLVGLIAEIAVRRRQYKT